MNTWLVGAGPMAAAHAAVMSDIGEAFMVVGRSEERARALAETHNAPWRAGGLRHALDRLGAPRRAVLCVPVETLAADAIALVEAGVGELLVEKPGGMTSGELERVARAGEAVGARINIAYNRRFYASAIEARRRIEAAGGPLSCHFEFTELSDRVAPLPTPAAVKERWLLGNSSHVIDLAFHLVGAPTSLTHDRKGSLPWHPAGALFRGFGDTARGAGFSYIADWRGPGRWGVEIVLPDERLVLRPLETLQSVARGRFDPAPVALDDDLDRRFKPGLHRQMSAFLGGGGDLPTMRAHQRMVADVIEPLAGYDAGDTPSTAAPSAAAPAAVPAAARARDAAMAEPIA